MEGRIFMAAAIARATSVAKRRIGLVPSVIPCFRSATFIDMGRE
jgi:hypothetical protein